MILFGDRLPWDPTWERKMGPRSVQFFGLELYHHKWTVIQFSVGTAIGTWWSWVRSQAKMSVWPKTKTRQDSSRFRKKLVYEESFTRGMKLVKASMHILVSKCEKSRDLHADTLERGLLLCLARLRMDAKWRSSKVETEWKERQRNSIV